MDAGARARRAAALLAALLACWPLARPAASEPAREIRFSPSLRANPTNTVRHVVSGVCEAEGLRQIARLLERSPFEEMWAFLPRARTGGACQWHEIGRDEKAMSRGAYLRVDMAYLETLMAENTEVHLYHFHPLRYFACAADASCRRVRTGRRKDLDPRWVTDLVYSMPSPSDVHFMMDTTSRFQRRHRGRGTIRHGVVTPHGVVRYGLTEQGLAKFEAERHSRSEGLYIVWVVGSALADERLEQVLRESPGSLEAAVRRLAQTLNTGFLWVAYSPLPARSAARANP
jgi:hypothetical protein